MNAKREKYYSYTIREDNIEKLEELRDKIVALAEDSIKN